MAWTLAGPGLSLRAGSGTRLAALDFMAHHPRWVNEPEQLVDYEGQPAMRIRLTDIASTARFTLFAHAQTWQVLAAFQA